MEKKTMHIPFELKELKEDGTFTGMLSPYGNVDFGKDIVEPGAFKKSLSQSSVVPFLYQHDPHNPIGTLELQDTPKGLYVKKGKLILEETENGYPRVPDAHRTYALMKAGVIKGLSIGYDTLEYEYDSKGIRHLKEIKLYEGSAVTFPMNELALIDSVKSSNKGGEKLEYKIGTKAFTFNENMQMRNLQDMRWRMQDALNKTLRDIMYDENMNVDEKLKKMDESLIQFHQLALKVYGGILKLKEKEKQQNAAAELVNTVTDALKSSVEEMETKAGATISKANMEKLKSAMEALKAILKSAGYSEDDQNKTDEVELELKKLYENIKKYKDNKEEN